MTGQRTGCNGDTVIGQELRSAQRGQGDDIVQAFRAAEARLGERQVGRDAQHNGVIQLGGQLVKFTNRCIPRKRRIRCSGKYNSVTLRLPANRSARRQRDLFGDQRNGSRGSASLRNGALNRNGVAPKCTVCDMFIFLFTYS